MADHLVARLFRDLLRQIVHKANLWVCDFPAADANEMRMWIRPISIVTIVIAAEAKLQHFAQILEEIERLVDGGRTGGGKLSLDLLVQMGCAGCPSLEAMSRNRATR